MGLMNGDSIAELQVIALQMDIGCFLVSLFNSTLEIITVVSYCKSQSKKKPASIRHPVFARSQLAFSAVSIENSALCLKGWKVALFCFFSTGWAHFELNWQTFAYYDMTNIWFGKWKEKYPHISDDLCLPFRILFILCPNYSSHPEKDLTLMLRPFDGLS